MAFAAGAGFACAFVAACAAVVSAASSEMAPSVGFHDAEPDDEGLRRRFSAGDAAVASSGDAAVASSGAAAGAVDVGGGGDRRARLTKANSFMGACGAYVWLPSPGFCFTVGRKS